VRAIECWAFVQILPYGLVCATREHNFATGWRPDRPFSVSVDIPESCLSLEKLD
jgi:hypothetical protein